MPLSTIRLRTEGFRHALEQHGLAFDPRYNLALIPPARSFRVSQSWHADDAYRVAADLLDRGRSEERRVGKECVSTCRSRWSPYPSKKKTQYDSRLHNSLLISIHLIHPSATTQIQHDEN